MITDILSREVSGRLPIAFDNSVCEVIKKSDGDACLYSDHEESPVRIVMSFIKELVP